MTIIPPIHQPIELHLLQAFNKKLLELTDSFISNIDDHVETYAREVRYQTHEEGEQEQIEVKVFHICGISEEEYDIKKIFSQVLPMYQRQSMLVTNWGIFENELTNYYSHLAPIFGKPRSLPKKEKTMNNHSKQKRTGSELDHLIRSFEKLGLISEKSARFNEAIEVLDCEVRFIRNDWVHNGGIPQKKARVDKVKGIALNGSQIDISACYLSTVMQHMQVLIAEISSSAMCLLPSQTNGDS